MRHELQNWRLLKPPSRARTTPDSRAIRRAGLGSACQALTPLRERHRDMTVTHDNPASQADLGEMRPRERRWNNRGRGKRSSRITGSMIIAACCSRVPGALAAAFADRTALKTAVDNCLLAVGTGENCCSSEMADCGAAGNVDMPN